MNTSSDDEEYAVSGDRDEMAFDFDNICVLPPPPLGSIDQVTGESTQEIMPQPPLKESVDEAAFQPEANNIPRSDSEMSKWKTILGSFRIPSARSVDDDANKVAGEATGPKCPETPPLTPPAKIDTMKSYENTFTKEYHPSEARSEPPQSDTQNKWFSILGHFGASFQSFRNNAESSRQGVTFQEEIPTPLPPPIPQDIDYGITYSGPEKEIHYTPDDDQHSSQEDIELSTKYQESTPGDQKTDIAIPSEGDEEKPASGADESIPYRPSAKNSLLNMCYNRKFQACVGVLVSLIIILAAVFGKPKPTPGPNLQPKNLNAEGYTYQWPGEEGWFVAPSYAGSGNASYKIYNTSNLEKCVEICSSKNAPGGNWYPVDNCICDFGVECLEPDVPGNGTVFSTISKPSQCSKSYCEYFPKDQTRCSNAHCKMNPGDLSCYGYNYKWAHDEGFFIAPSYVGTGKQSFETSKADSLVECAKLCSEHDALGGAWYPDPDNTCYCDYGVECLEPNPSSIDGMIFSTVLKPPKCPESYCDYFPEDLASCYGYFYSWPAKEGWFVAPSYSGTGSYSFETFKADNLVECAKLCSEKKALGGNWYPKDNCVCDFGVECLEPDITRNGTVFSIDPKPSKCSNSYCDYFPEDLDCYGYSYSWPAKEGWFVAPSYSGTGSYSFETLKADSLGECAKLCSEKKALGGNWYSKDNCICDFGVECLEPDITRNGTVFSTVPKPLKCSKSYCDYFPKDLSCYQSIHVATTSGNKCAETLPFGPNLNNAWDGSSPYFCTSCALVPHTIWVQLFWGDNFDQWRFAIIWYFDTSKNLSNRFDSAASYGEPVTWLILLSSGETETIVGTWHWSSSSGGWPDLYFGDSFSNDDGCFGAGYVVDGNLRGRPKWGQCNYDGSDALCKELYENGISKTFEKVQTQLYVLIPND